jgi:hypothetical protein
MPILPGSAACAAAAGNFLFLGKLLARCMMDGRLFDLPLSPLIFKVGHVHVLPQDASHSSQGSMPPVPHP